jgi:hypothetical protein
MEQAYLVLLLLVLCLHRIYIFYARTMHGIFIVQFDRNRASFLVQIHVFDFGLIFSADWVSPYFFSWKSQANYRRIHWNMARSAVQKIITWSVHASGSNFCRIWSLRQLHLATHSCSVCCCIGPTNCISAK